VEVDDDTVTQVSDHVQRLAGTIILSGIQTERPASGQGGPDYVAQLIAWLDAAGGELLDVAFPDRPVQLGYVLQAAPWRVRLLEDLPVTLTLTQVRRVVSQLVDGPTVARGGRRPRRDAQAAAAPDVNTGEAATQPVPVSTLKAGLRVVSSLVAP
jgi:hypothetical protein